MGTTTNPSFTVKLRKCRNSLKLNYEYLRLMNPVETLTNSNFYR
ncbi:hypothetical protein LEP1GSC077_1864 [Leptospira interrogans str. C10069]|uniref:Uncharacterized protein n=1 Tax=Leptospira interrogans serovar Pyrogenes str. 200701872 TaxID=1193029 RepID=M6ZTP2_LEPIR|nr:hypothetical protein LEP1GSC077_1864 [Leptospira interrogans str. C10069]EMJ55358.1 hypothetical protein LEP1GSC111_2771 [Leptospira interrogans str. UT126]EMP05120.1 hypothetical protein LEP1GSC124_3736 [Leptospira interrogans serovar Pyrogenes str. 200701872]